jgi:hypothetical protein
MLNANGARGPGQSWTAAKTPSCWVGDRSRAFRIASPVPIPASVSYALKKTRKRPETDSCDPGVRVSEGVGQQDYRQPDEADEYQLNDVEDGEPRRYLEHGLDGGFRLRMQRLESRQQEGWQEQQHQT